ncbi:glutamic acid-rich protein [Blumeria hordei DH14]|uniref:Glutamic acid-rich protein n=1 Tax=Blumeria graminis f. sp. hordei (strain DH14) TaxID=546991 RepID=N1JHM7_BLUG1|nr:glutamic acid-rich protein [Blumeria hordei DH14]
MAEDIMEISSVPYGDEEFDFDFDLTAPEDEDAVLEDVVSSEVTDAYHVNHPSTANDYLMVDEDDSTQYINDAESIWDCGEQIQEDSMSLTSESRLNSGLLLKEPENLFESKVFRDSAARHSPDDPDIEIPHKDSKKLLDCEIPRDSAKHNCPDDSNPESPNKDSEAPLDCETPRDSNEIQSHNEVNLKTSLGDCTKITDPKILRYTTQYQGDEDSKTESLQNYFTRENFEEDPLEISKKAVDSKNEENSEENLTLAHDEEELISYKNINAKVANCAMSSGSQITALESQQGATKTKFRPKNRDYSKILDSDQQNLCCAQGKIVSNDVTILYQSNEYALFSTSDSDDPNSFFLTDRSILQNSLSKLFEAIRDVIHDDLSHEDELFISVPDFGLQTEEGSTSAQDMTLSQVIELRNQLLLNDGIETQEPIYIDLGIRKSFKMGLAKIALYANHGKGLSEITAWNDHSQNTEDIPLNEASTEIYYGEKYPYDETLDEEKVENLHTDNHSAGSPSKNNDFSPDKSHELLENCGHEREEEFYIETGSVPSPSRPQEELNSNTSNKPPPDIENSVIGCSESKSKTAFRGSFEDDGDTIGYSEDEFDDSSASSSTHAAAPDQNTSAVHLSDDRITSNYMHETDPPEMKSDFPDISEDDHHNIPPNSHISERKIPEHSPLDSSNTNPCGDGLEMLSQVTRNESEREDFSEKNDNVPAVEEIDTAEKVHGNIKINSLVDTNDLKITKSGPGGENQREPSEVDVESQNFRLSRNVIAQEYQIRSEADNDSGSVTDYNDVQNKDASAGIIEMNKNFKPEDVCVEESREVSYFSPAGDPQEITSSDSIGYEDEIDYDEDEDEVEVESSQSNAENLLTLTYSPNVENNSPPTTGKRSRESCGAEKIEEVKASTTMISYCLIVTDTHSLNSMQYLSISCSFNCLAQVRLKVETDNAFSSPAQQNA